MVFPLQFWWLGIATAAAVAVVIEHVLLARHIRKWLWWRILLVHLFYSGVVGI